MNTHCGISTVSIGMGIEWISYLFNKVIMQKHLIISLLARTTAGKSALLHGIG
jgi:hypothetical protein